MVNIKIKNYLIFILNAIMLQFFLSAEPVFQGNEEKMKVSPTNKNYYLATLIGESQSYDPTFYDDYILSIDDIPVVHFTKIDGLVLDYFFYIKDPDDLRLIRSFFKKNKQELREISEDMYMTFINYRAASPEFKVQNLYKEVEQSIQNITQITLSRVVGESPHLDAIDQALFQYLLSNGINKIEEIEKRPELINMIVNKFYMLSTTYFYRDWSHVKAFKDYLPPLKVKIQKENRPFKAKVFACSSGEEVFTYAIELLEAGIDDFRLLASDINDACLNSASKMKFPYTSFSRLTLKIQKRLKKYFKLNETLNIWELKDPEFFKKKNKIRSSKYSQRSAG